MNSVSPNNSFKQNLANFLYEKDLLQLILAVYLGTALEQFFNSFVIGIVLPFMMLFIPKTQYDDLQDIQITILDQKLSVGLVIFKLINLFIGFLVSYIFVAFFLRKYLK